MTLLSGAGRRAVISVLLVGCAGDAIESDRRQVANAEADREHEAVVALFADGELFCSGTVIDARVVLTATHCLARWSSAGDADLEVGFGADAMSGERIEVVEIGKHPDWRPDVQANDIALVALADDAPVDAVEIRREVLGEADQGRHVTLVGYGVSDLQAGDAGQRRSGQAPIAAVGANQIAINGGEGAPSICPGDSGGPSLLDGRIAGVHSRASCSTLSLDERVDIHAVRIDDFVADHPPEVGDCSAGGSGGFAAVLLVSWAARSARSRCRSRARSRC